MTTFVVPTGALDYWAARLRRFGITPMKAARFGESYVQFADPEGLHLELVEREEGPLSRWAAGAGTVHHIAWRAQDAAEHREWQRHVAASGFQPTDVIDRQYFHALYFRESAFCSKSPPTRRVLPWMKRRRNWVRA